MIITVATQPLRYFFSGTLKLTPGQEILVELEDLTQSQLFDLIDSETTGNLLIPDIASVQQKYQEVLLIPSLPVLPTGPQGPQGAIGNEGPGAYLEAVSEGFLGTRKEWLKSLKGIDAEILQPPSTQSFKDAYNAQQI